MTHYLLQTFPHMTSDQYDKLLKTLNFYMLEVSEDDKQLLFYFIYNNSIFIIPHNDVTHNLNSLNNLIRLSIDADFLLINMNNFRGFCDSRISDFLNNECPEFFKNTKIERKKYSRILKIKNILEEENIKGIKNILEKPFLDRSYE